MIRLIIKDKHTYSTDYIYRLERSSLMMKHAQSARNSLESIGYSVDIDAIFHEKDNGMTTTLEEYTHCKKLLGIVFIAGLMFGAGFISLFII